MRSWNDWMQSLKPELSHTGLEKTELETFLNLEYCLTLHYHLTPERPAEDAWALVSGYLDPSVHQDIEARKASAIARPRARFLRTQESFKFWLNWYQTLTLDWRLFDFDVTGKCKLHQPTIASHRQSIYEEALFTASPYQERDYSWAQAGEYHFVSNSSTGRPERRSVTISQSFTKFAQEDAHNIPHFRTPIINRSDIVISFSELKAAAEWLQEHDPNGDWVRRFEERVLNLKLLNRDGTLSENDSMTINRMFHLVGMVNAGKSTLIDLIIVALSLREKPLHITLMVNTVVEAIEKAAYFRQLGLAAAPVLGQDRKSHRQKYGQAKITSLLPNVVFTDDPISDVSLRWISGACALSAETDNGKPIPVGEEPCRRLLDDKDKEHTCPLLLRCSVHQASQDLCNSNIWIVTPASFLFSRAPDGFSQADMRLLEAIYYHSDLLIVDEADRVQLQWDNHFAPISNLFGYGDGLIQELNEALNSRNDASLLIHGHIASFRNKARHVITLTESAYALLLREKDLREWCGRIPLTPTALFFQLAGELAQTRFDWQTELEAHEELRNSLYTEFKRYIRFPDSKDGEPLSAWVNDFRQYNNPNALRASIIQWLVEVRGFTWWDELENKERHRLTKRFEFALLLKAMDKYLDEVLREIAWVAPVLDIKISSYFVVPEEHTDVIPDSPIGNLLGYHFLEQDNILRFMRCQGIGRWLLTHFHNLYADMDDVEGPHVFLTSATSWAKGSTFFHLIAPPDAVLELSPEDRKIITHESQYEFNNLGDELIRVSGSSLTRRRSNLETLVQRLAHSVGRLQSPLEQELTYWKKQGQKRRVLIVVGSYDEAAFVTKTLNDHPNWKNRVRRMRSDDPNDHELRRNDDGIARGQIQSLRHYEDADVLVAPLLAIQRGYNILNEDGAALLGSAFFLVRPLPIPDDFGQHLIGVNSWAMNQLYENAGFLAWSKKEGELPMKAFRNDAYSEQWIKRLEDSQGGMVGLPPDLLEELLWNQMVIVWQTIGRLVRRGRPARVIFVDGAFMKQPPMLVGWWQILNQYFGESVDIQTLDTAMANTLYRPFYTPLAKLVAKYIQQEAQSDDA